MALVVKNPPAKAGATGATGLTPGSGRPPGGGMATQPSAPAWGTPRTERLAGYRSWVRRVGQGWETDHNTQLDLKYFWQFLTHSGCSVSARFHFSLSIISHWTTNRIVRTHVMGCEPLIHISLFNSRLNPRELVLLASPLHEQGNWGS